MKTNCKVLNHLKHLYFLINFFFLFTINAQAYIDPSVMTYAIQAIAGIAIALGTFFNIYWRKIRKKIGFSGIFKNRYSQTETDDLYFNDPLSGKTVKPEIKRNENILPAGVKKKSFLSDFWSEYKYALILSAAISFMVMIFSPLDLYLNNAKDFWFDFGIILPVLLKAFIISTVVLALISALCLLLFDELFHVVYLGAFAVFLCSYIQGNFLAGRLPALDGTAVDWSQYHVDILQSRYLWFSLALLILLLARFVRMKGIYKITAYMNGLISAMLMISLITVGIKNNGFAGKDYRVATSDHLFEMSEKQNFIILMVDTLDARIFSQVVNQHPEYQEYFEDFTFFPDTVGAYTFTSYALPHALTGKWMENETDYQTYFRQAMDEAPLFQNLKSDGYRMGMFETCLYYDSDNILEFENFRKADVGFRSEKEFIKEELKLFAFKYAPYQLKRFISPDLQYFFRTQAVNGDLELFSDNNQYFYNKVREGEVVVTPDKCFRFIHIEGAHVPFRYNENVELIDTSEGTYEQNVLCSITIMNEYLQMLKKAGVYDNSAIIMMGDHGFNYDNDQHLGRQNPVLLVKGMNEKHPYEVSDAPLSYADLQEAYARLMAGRNAQECFDAKAGDVRERRYMFFHREAELTEYIQTGYASDTETLIPTGRVFKRDVDYLAEFHIN